MLYQRVITALLLLALLLPALFYPQPTVFAAVVLLFITAAAWEWARLNGCAQAASLCWAGLCASLCVGLWVVGALQLPLLPLWQGAALAWVLGGAWVLRRGVPAWGQLAPLLRQLVGMLILVLAWLAVARARQVGINFLLSCLVLVWVADVFAYFVGRRFGRRKLALTISPGKSWEGVWGGLVGVLVLAFVWRAADSALQADVPSLYSRIAAPGAWMLVLTLPFLVAMSVVGDLLESLVKRSAGVKDSSGLLPGHGGVLDRVDALLPLMPLVMLWA